MKEEFENCHVKVTLTHYGNPGDRLTFTKSKLSSEPGPDDCEFIIDDLHTFTHQYGQITQITYLAYVYNVKPPKVTEKFILVAVKNINNEVIFWNCSFVGNGDVEISSNRCCKGTGLGNGGPA